MKELEGSIKSEIFKNTQNGFCVYRIVRKDNGREAVVVGIFQNLTKGESVRFKGKWEKNKHGMQFQAQSAFPITPTTNKGIEKFLSSGLIPGVGPVMAKRIVNKYGNKTLKIIEKDPSKLTKVTGIGKKSSFKIGKAVVKHKEIRDTMVFLESLGFSPTFALRIYEKYKDKTIKFVSDNPYCVATDISGMGFITVDKLAPQMGIAADSPHRAEAGLIYALEKTTQESNVFEYRKILIEKASLLLDVPKDKLDFALKRLVLLGKVRVEKILEKECVYLPKMHKIENEAASTLNFFLNSPGKNFLAVSEDTIKKIQKNSNLNFSKEQKQAFHVLPESKVLILTGGPGTGKTTLLKGICDYFKNVNMKIMLAAPTGRAAKRMSQSTQRESKTLHRLLEFIPAKMKFAKDKTNPLNTDVLIVDEISMVDLELFNAFLQALPKNARLILVGDPEQLPSVGPGNVILDLINAAGKIGKGLKLVRLTSIFRQARSSLIISGAHSILHGYLPKSAKKGEKGDLFFIKREDPDECLDTILQLVTKRIPERFHFDPVRDTQVLTPMHKGILGVENLNSVLRERLNPKKTFVKFGDVKFSPGDKVMQVRNNYDHNIFNGDIGQVSSIDEYLKTVHVRFENALVKYSLKESGQIMPAFACSIHKSQGSEYPCVVIPFGTQHFIMLKRNLLYTAVTRAKELVVIVGSGRALKMAVDNNSIVKRKSNLGYRLKNL